MKEQKVTIEGQLKKAEADLAQLNVTRAEELQLAKAGHKEEVDIYQARLKTVERDLEEAMAKLKLAQDKIDLVHSKASDALPLMLVVHLFF